MEKRCKSIRQLAMGKKTSKQGIPKYRDTGTPDTNKGRDTYGKGYIR